MNKQYDKGVRFEREVIQLLRKAGYTVARTKGSHGVFDLAAVKETEHNSKQIWVGLFIQCKVMKLNE